MKIFIFPSDRIFHAMNFCEKKFRFFLKPENPIFLRSTRAADHSFDLPRVVTYIQERVTTGLTNLACFTTVNVAS